MFFYKPGKNIEPALQWKRGGAPSICSTAHIHTTTVHIDLKCCSLHDEDCWSVWGSTRNHCLQRVAVMKKAPLVDWCVNKHVCMRSMMMMMMVRRSSGNRAVIPECLLCYWAVLLTKASYLSLSLSHRVCVCIWHTKCGIGLFGKEQCVLSQLFGTGLLADLCRPFSYFFFLNRTVNYIHIKWGFNVVVTTLGTWHQSGQVLNQST